MASTNPPRKDDALLAWSANAKTLITATPTAYGLTAAFATQYGGIHDLFATALAACEPGVRTQAAVAAKNTARANLLEQIRLMTNLVNGTATVTDAQKITLGITVRAQPSPQPPPSSWPILTVKSSYGTMVTLGLGSSDPGSKRGRPAGVFGASVFSFVGAEAPSDISEWKFEGNTGRTQLTVTFPSDTAPGTKVFFTAFWFNGSKASGPACAAISTNLPGGSVPMAA